MMKKLTAILLAALLALSLAACGGEAPESDLPTPGAEEPPAESLPAATPGAAGAPEFKRTAQIAETVLVDENGLRITAAGLSYTNYSAEIALRIENTGSADLSVTSGTIGYSCNSVNGFMVDDGYLNCDVTAGNSANETVSLSYDPLLLMGIDSLAEIELGFAVSDEDYNTTCTGPRQILTSEAAGYEPNPNSYQEAVGSAGVLEGFGLSLPWYSAGDFGGCAGIEARSAALAGNADGEYMLLLELENTTDAQLNAVTGDIFVNGLIVYNGGRWSIDTINAGKRALAAIDLSYAADALYAAEYGVDGLPSGVSLILTAEDMDHAEIGGPLRLDFDLGGGRAFDGGGAEVYSGDGLRILYKGLVRDGSDYGGEIYVLLLAENSGQAPAKISDEYGTLAVNGVMTDYSFPWVDIPAGESAAVVIELWESSLSENGVTSTADVSLIELDLTAETQSGEREFTLSIDAGN